MTLNFYTLGVLYLVYSFLGWVGETVVATFRGKRFANRGMAAGPFCFVYGTTAILIGSGLCRYAHKAGGAVCGLYAYGYRGGVAHGKAAGAAAQSQMVGLLR